MKSRLTRNYGQTCAQDIVVIFDNYGTELVAKDHERQRRGGAETMKYNLTTNTPFLVRDSVIKSTDNKKQLFSLLSNLDSQAEKHRE